MTNSDSSRNNPITAVAFEPAGVAHRPRRLPPLATVAVAVLMAVVLAMVLAVLWFVFTARSLTIQVAPANAAVFVSGGLTFAVADHFLLRPGTYRLGASAPGYQDLDLDISVGTEPEQTVVVELDKLPGQLAVVTEPEGARILLDGRDRGETPQTLADLPAGDYRVELLHPRHQPWRGELTLPGMAITERLEVALEPAWGLINLTSDPAGAEVSVGGQTVGTTPLAVQVLESGEPVTLKLAGHRRWEQVLFGVIGQTVEQPTITLTPAAGVASVTSTPGNATVTVDNEYRGRTPVELELEPDREHSIVLLLDGYHSAEQRLQLAAGEERTLNIPLRANLGTLHLSASPPGAALLVDGQQREPHRPPAPRHGATDSLRAAPRHPGRSLRPGGTDYHRRRPESAADGACGQPHSRLVAA